MGSLTALVSGMIAGDPHQGGATWAVLQYPLGLRRLGHEVVLVEPVAPESISPPGATLENSDNAAYFRQVTAEHGLEGSSALLLTGTTETIGLSYEHLRERARDIDVLVNISGMLTDGELTGHAGARVYLDLDPAFNQLWHASGIDMRFDGHTHFVTVGQAVGTPGSPVPDCGRDWIPTLPPVVLELWPRAERVELNALTTVGHWRGYGSIEHEGLHYGQKAHSLRQFISLPTLTATDFVLAMEIHEGEKKDLEALARNGWKLLDPLEVAGSPDQYQHFVQGSKGEIGVAKSGYVVSRSAWFSDRSACYLASGRPVIAQETGFSDFLPTGEGLFGFSTTEEALAAVAELERDYDRHADAARRLAEDQLDSDLVLGRLLERIGITP
jgi:hypothetical protein